MTTQGKGKQKSGPGASRAPVADDAQQRLLDGLPDVVWLKNREGKYEAVNERFLSLYNLPLHGVVGKNDDDLFPADIAERYRKTDREVLECGETRRYEEIAQTGTGHRIVVECVKTPVYGKDGEVVGISGTTRNITEHWRADETLQKERETFLSILNSAPYGVLLIAPDGTYLYCNPEFVSITGYTLADIPSGREWFRKAFPDKETRKGVIGTWLADRHLKLVDREFPVTCKDGCVKDIEFRTTRLENDNSITMIADITRRKQAEEALRATEEKYRGIYENAIEGIFQTAPDGRFISANPALVRIFGYDSAEGLMESVTDAQLFVSPKQRDEYLQLMEIEGTVRGFEAQVYCRDRSVTWVSINARTVRDQGGGTLYYEGTVESITERKKLEAQLRHSQKMESVGTLAGGVAHDFNNILTTIMGYCSLMIMKAGDDHRFRGYLDQILEAANRASTLTQSLLAFGRKQPVEAQPMDINQGIRGVEKLLARIIGEDIELKTLLADGKLIVMMGEGQIVQVLMNLVSNARDAMPDGGVLQIKTEQVHLSGDFVKSHDGKDGAFACIEVSDTGSGMDERTRDQIFDPFFTTKEVGKGTGLGLSIVYGIVSQSDGYINVSSELGKGSTFTIYLPLLQSEKGVQTLREKVELRGGNETVLVAEDNSQVREIVTATLRDFGYVVIEAVDGEDAVQKFAEQADKIDLLLLDVIMPRKNGMEAYTQMKKMRPDIRAIFMSGYTGDILSRKGIGREGIPLISKPIVIEKLLTQVRQVLEKKPSQLSLFP